MKFLSVIHAGQFLWDLSRPIFLIMFAFLLQWLFWVVRITVVKVLIEWLGTHASSYLLKQPNLFWRGWGISISCCERRLNSFVILLHPYLSCIRYWFIYLYVGTISCYAPCGCAFLEIDRNSLGFWYGSKEFLLCFLCKLEKSGQDFGYFSSKG